MEIAPNGRKRHKSEDSVFSTFARAGAQVDFILPKDVEGLALGILVRAGQSDKRRLAWRLRGHNLFDQPPAGAYLNEFPHFRLPSRQEFPDTL